MSRDSDAEMIGDVFDGMSFETTVAGQSVQDADATDREGYPEW
jgi:hypothetical protein